MAGGRLAAFANIASDHPDWQLHIHGEGVQRAALTRQIRALDLVGRVRLCGYAADLYDALSQASVFAMSSRANARRTPPFPGDGTL